MAWQRKRPIIVRQVSNIKNHKCLERKLKAIYKFC